MNLYKDRPGGPDRTPGHQDKNLKIMKKALIAVMTISLLAVSCSKKSVVETNQNVVNQICFDNVSTKAEVTEASDIKEFGVFAEQSLGASGTSQSEVYVSLLENEKVYRDEYDVFVYDNKRYWMNNHTYRFFAYHPYFDAKSNATTCITGVSTTSDATGFPYFNISFVTPPAADADFLVATPENITIDDDPATDYPTVELLFSHAVSKVKVKIAKHGKNKDNRIVINSIEFGGIAKSGTYSAVNKEWSDLSESLTLSAGDITLDANDIEFHDAINGMFIPQSINPSNTKSMYIKVNYDFYTIGEDQEWVKDEVSYNATSYLPAGKWEASNSYVYKLTLSAVDNTISFKSPEVALWGTPNPAGSIIIQ